MQSIMNYILDYFKKDKEISKSETLSFDVRKRTQVIAGIEYSRLSLNIAG